MQEVGIYEREMFCTHPIGVYVSLQITVYIRVNDNVNIQILGHPINIVDCDGQ